MNKQLYFAFPLLCALLLTACGGKSTPTQPPAATEPAATSAPVQVEATATPATERPVVAPPPVSQPDFDGNATLQIRCTVCHSLDRVTSAKKTADEWAQLVTRMVQKGAELTAQEQTLLVEYLAQTYHP